jgi:hypothetical protein
VENVLNRYEKDGLAFQRYGRIRQEGLGDDILSGNSLALVGLYKAIYGINPCYNRLYLNPHLPEKLSGTVLNYNFRKDTLKIVLTTGHYSISNHQFKIGSTSDFGFYSEKNELLYFKGNDDHYSLLAQTASNISLEILKWNADEFNWLQSSSTEKGTVSYILHVSQPNSIYAISDGSKSMNVKSDKDGLLKFEVRTNKEERHLEIKPI